MDQKSMHTAVIYEPPVLFYLHKLTQNEQQILMQQAVQFLLLFHNFVGVESSCMCHKMMCHIFPKHQCCVTCCPPLGIPLNILWNLLPTEVYSNCTTNSHKASRHISLDAVSNCLVDRSRISIHAPEDDNMRHHQCVIKLCCFPLPLNVQQIILTHQAGLVPLLIIVSCCYCLPENSYTAKQAQFLLLFRTVVG
jgi:hypothetical protein